MAWIAETQSVETGNRARAHGENVAQNAANTSGRALIRLDVARVIVALHLEDHRKAVADIDDARILARPLNDPRRLGRQAAQMDARGFVGTVLVPHRREDAEFREGRYAPISFRMRSYSSGLRPWLATRSGVIWGSFLIVKATSLRVKCFGVPPGNQRGRMRRNMRDSGPLCARRPGLRQASDRQKSRLKKPPKPPARYAPPGLRKARGRRCCP